MISGESIPTSVKLLLSKLKTVHKFRVLVIAAFVLVSWERVLYVPDGSRPASLFYQIEGIFSSKFANERWNF
jgi:hypothetical protein